MKINELSIMTLFNNDFVSQNRPIFQPLYLKKKSPYKASGTIGKFFRLFSLRF